MFNPRSTHMTSSARGREAEERAWEFLQKQGARLLGRNYRCKVGEIDLIVRDGENLVFVEVRYRRDDRFGSAAESVDARKQARLIAAAQHYLHRHRSVANKPARFDVVSIAPRQDGLDIQWIRDAFQAGG